MSEKVDRQLQRKIKYILIKNKKECEKRLRELNKRAREILVDTSESGSFSNHPADNATSICIPLVQIPTLRKLIMKYDEALKRVGEGTYGICKDCGEPIPIARLEKVPFADRCIICKEKAELLDTVPINGGLRLSRPPVIMI